VHGARLRKDGTSAKIPDLKELSSSVTTEIRAYSATKHVHIRK